MSYFDKDKRTISEHIKNIFNEGELQEGSVVRNFRTTAADGKNYQVIHYNLDVKYRQQLNELLSPVEKIFHYPVYRAHPDFSFSCLSQFKSILEVFLAECWPRAQGTYYLDIKLKLICLRVTKKQLYLNHKTC